MNNKKPLSQVIIENLKKEIDILETQRENAEKKGSVDDIIKATMAVAKIKQDSFKIEAQTAALAHASRSHNGER